MLEALKEQVLQANLELVRQGLVTLTFGNASGIDRGGGLVVIKPSGVAYQALKPRDLSVVRLTDGTLVEGAKPSSDTPAHLELYRAFGAIGGAVHTHSPWATAWAQAAREIPAMGTTHADHFLGPVPCTRPLRPEEIAGDYEAATGRVIVERLRGLDPLGMPACLVVNHGPFTWGAAPGEAAENAVALEFAARTAFLALQLAPEAGPIDRALLQKHFFRKHGPGAYYGQG
jgi:L-ribulose-5-phosphate 4-epimerase